MERSSKTKTVMAPTSSPGNQNVVISVDCAEDEEVQWTWTYLPNGQRFVSGYTKIKKAAEKK